MFVVCAWCEKVLGWKPDPLIDGKVIDPHRLISHGLCPACEEKLKAEETAIERERLAPLDPRD